MIEGKAFCNKEQSLIINAAGLEKNTNEIKLGSYYDNQRRDGYVYFGRGEDEDEEEQDIQIGNSNQVDVILPKDEGFGPRHFLI
jgi:hypothetical protein